MTRESPPTRRVLALLDAVASDAATGLSLAELAARSGVSRPTALGILNELAAAGWLTRDEPAKTYRPGPGMLAAGAAAAAAFPDVRAGRARLRLLAEQAGAPVTASAVVDGAVTVLERVGARGGSSAFRVGQRYPFAPPSGVMFVAWQGDDEVDAWFARRPLSPLPTDEKALRAVVASCRQRGYLVVGLGELTAGLYALLDGVSDEELAGRLGDLLHRTVPAGVQPYLVEPIDAAARYDVSLVCAPVVQSGQFCYLVAVLVMQAGVAGSQLARTAAMLTAATGELSRLR